jgi:DNA-binding PadR family transcriptional regulator
MRALDELVAKGFIDIAWSGSGGKKGDVSLYAVSDRWTDYGTHKFQSATRPRDTREGRGFRRGNTEWMKARRAIIGAKDGNSTVAENDNSKAEERALSCQEQQSKKHGEMTESLASMGWSPIFPV